MDRYYHDIIIAVESILANKLRSMLTALGIIFGVAAVISMLAIGNGARQEILEQIKMVGVNNINITPVIPGDEGEEGEESEGENGKKEKQKYSPGLTLLDVDAIKTVLPSVNLVSPEISVNSFAVKEGIREPAKLIGVASEYFDMYNLPLSEGMYFSDVHEDIGLPVCVIGANIKTRFFASEPPIDNYLKFGNVWLKVIGVLEKSDVSVSSFENTGVNVQNDNIYIPVKTMLMRFKNRALINSKKMTEARGFLGGWFFSFRGGGGNSGSKNYHQLDKIVVQVKETQELTPTTEVLSRMMLRRHSGVQDFEITVPELLLKQQQRTKDIFNIVLGAIAGISLLVGGIGIMNIMFATVMERIKEIGTRMAIGATRKDIVVQFLAEAMLISIIGGLIGVALGIGLSKAITYFADIRTIVSPVSVFIAFAVSATVGIIFGYSPSKRASEKDPIESLRYE